MNWTRITAGSLALLLLGLAAYWPGLNGGFLFDDYPNLVRDPDWKVTALEWEQWRRAASHGIASDAGRALALLSFALNHFFSGLDPWPMKLTNVLMHVGNGVIVFLLSRRVFSLARSNGPAPGDLASWVIAAAWLAHPLQVSTVLYVVQRMEVGAQGFTLLALLFYVVARSRQMEDRRAWTWLSAAVLSTILGLGFKESALLAPVFACLIEVTLIRFKSNKGNTSLAWKQFYLLMIAAGAVIYFAFILPKYLEESAYINRDFTMLERIMTQPRVLVMYLGQIIWPNPESLLFYYDHLGASKGPLTPFSTLGALLLSAGLLTFAFWTRNRRPLITLGIGWFFAAHALTSNVVPLELAFEHRNYLALLGILIGIAGLLAGSMSQFEAATKRGLLLLPVLTLATLTLLQSLTWSNPLTLATTLASRNPQSARASYDLATEWLLMAGNDSDHPLWSLAYDEFENASKLPNSSGLGEQGQIIMLARASKPIPTEIWERLRARYDDGKTTPELEAALHTLVDCRIRFGCVMDDNELQLTLMHAVESNATSAVFRVQYSNFAFNVMGDPKLALVLLRESIQLEPTNPTFRAGLVKMLLASNLLDTKEIESHMIIIRTQNANGELDVDLAEIASLRAKAATASGATR